MCGGMEGGVPQSTTPEPNVGMYSRYVEEEDGNYTITQELRFLAFRCKNHTSCVV